MIKLMKNKKVIKACGWTHPGPVGGFLVFWLQIAIGPFALFHHSGFDYTCICFNVMFYK